MAKVDLSIKEIYAALCPKCQEKIRSLVKDKLAEQMLDRALGGPGSEEGNDDKRIPGPES